MAEQPAPTAPPAVPATTAKGHAAELAALGDFLKRYTPSYLEPSRDTLEGRWHIQLSTPLPEFDTKNARAYAAIDLNHAEKRLFALVCRPGTYQRHRIIPALKALQHPNILQLVGAGIVELSQPQEERFVLFYDRPIGKKISELLSETKGELNEAFLIKSIIGPLVSVIHKLSQAGVPHGRINPDNIYFHTYPILGDCISEPCGYSQPFMYESLERMQAQPAAKGEGDSAQDFYALAILVLYLQHSTKHFTGWTPESLIHAILHEGGYNAIMRDKENSVMFEEFFRGLLLQNVEDRWDYEYLKQWLEGKRFNVLVPPLPLEAMRPFELGNSHASTKRELAHVFYTHWSSIPGVLESGQLIQWINISLRNKALAESIARINSAIRDLGSKKDPLHLNEQLMRVLLLFDSVGPIRFPPFSMHVDGIDSLYAELYANKADAELQLMAKFIELNMINFWLQHQPKESSHHHSVSVNTMLTKLERLRLCIRNTGMGFGLERILYDLNPDMPCLSPMLSHSHAVTLPSLLKQLDRLAPKLSGTQDPLDRHIAAFIASKLNIQHDIRLHELAGLSSLANNPSIIALKLLSLAQQRSTDLPLPGLTHWLGARILPALKTLRSRTLLDHLVSMLIERIETGNLPYMAELIIDSNYATADQDGYNRATQTYRSNIGEIAALRRGDGLEEKSSRLGYGIAKIIASAAFVMTLLSIAHELGK